MTRLSLLIPLFALCCACSSQRSGTALDKPAPPIAAAPASPNAAELAEVRGIVAGRESEPAEKVFKNIRILNGIPAGRVGAIMEIAFSRSLGVRCSYCHQGQWDYDTLPAKNLAREMWVFNRKLNHDLLPTVTGMEARNATVNCTTCHRGSVKPALDF